MDIRHLEIVTKLQELKTDVLKDAGTIRHNRELVEQSEFARQHRLAQIECWKKEETILIDLAGGIDEALKKLGVTFS